MAKALEIGDLLRRAAVRASYISDLVSRDDVALLLALRDAVPLLLECLEAAVECADMADDHGHYCVHCQVNDGDVSVPLKHAPDCLSVRAAALRAAWGLAALPSGTDQEREHG